MKIIYIKNIGSIFFFYYLLSSVLLYIIVYFVIVVWVEKKKPIFVTFLSLGFFIIKLILRLVYDCSVPLGDTVSGMTWTGLWIELRIDIGCAFWEIKMDG